VGKDKVQRNANGEGVGQALERATGKNKEVPSPTKGVGAGAMEKKILKKRKLRQTSRTKNTKEMVLLGHNGTTEMAQSHRESLTEGERTGVDKIRGGAKRRKPRTAELKWIRPNKKSVQK